MPKLVIKGNFSPQQQTLIHLAFARLKSIINFNTFNKLFEEIPEIEEIIIFGSQTRLQETPTSDLDIILLPHQELYDQLDDALMESLLKKALDVIYQRLTFPIYKLDIKIDNDYSETFSGLSIVAKNPNNYYITDFGFYPEQLGSFFRLNKQAVFFEHYYANDSLVFVDDKFNTPKRT